MARHNHLHTAQPNSRNDRCHSCASLSANVPVEPRRRDWLVVLLAVAINAIVLVNARLHDPLIGYDARAHLAYVRVLSEGRLPTEADTYEFFTPPLSYLPAALARSLGSGRLFLSGKLAQYLNVLYSLGVTLCLIRLCDRIRPGNRGFKRASLLLLGMVPVFYKTFAFVRPEPLLVFLSLLVIERALGIFILDRLDWRSVALLGLLLGLLLLVRQQAGFVIVALGLFVVARAIARKANRLAYLRALAVALAVAAAIAGWFYVGLAAKRGGPIAYTRPSVPFSLANNPSRFYLGTGDGMLFMDPVRPAFRNQLLPKLYSETWGDYECYFLVYGVDRRTHSFLSGGDLESALLRRRARFFLRTNRIEEGRYLGRVNLVALIPSGILVCGLFAGAFFAGRSWRDFQDVRGPALALLWLVTAVTFLAYVVLLVIYPSPSGNMIKATYVLHVLPLAAILAADLLERARLWSRPVFLAALVGLVVAAAHNGPALFTSYRQDVLTRSN